MRKLGTYRRPRLSALAVAVQAALGVPAWALPQGAVVVNGQVGISQPAPGTLQVTAGNGAIINWQAFSIGPGELARFVQPSAQSAVLNRVTGGNASQLLGQLQANGQVFLINPSGIVVGSGARIDTNSFVASTLDLSDADFLAGRMRFMASGAAGAIRNDGIITAGPGGKVALIAPDVTNSGIIHAPDGQILLAAGRSIEITSSDHAGVRFEVQAPTDSVLNLGKLIAENGAVHAFAATLRNTGEIRADRMVQGADGSIALVASGELTLGATSVVSASGLGGGQVRLQSLAGTTRVGGQVLATGSEGAGGSVQVLGDRVALNAGSLVDASGRSGGGQVLVGGDFQGANAQVPNARRVSVAEGATLRADATGQGDGGRIIVWADENTRFGGALSARGGEQGGNGGFAEVSGKQNLQFTGSADLKAPRGALGMLLLDPLDIIVAIGSGVVPSVTDEFADFAPNVVTIDPTRLNALGANVTLQANRHVFVKDAIGLTTAGAGITILAGGTTSQGGGIALEHASGISTTGGAVLLRGQSLTGPGTIRTAGGAVDIQTHGHLEYGGAIDSGGGAVTLRSVTGSITGADVNAGSGAISAHGQSGISGGRYVTSGTASLSTQEGQIDVHRLTAGVADLRASGSIDATVQVSDRVNAESTESSVSLANLDGSLLRLGTVRAAGGIGLATTGGLAQASGGALHTSSLTLHAGNSAVAAGSAAAPLHLVSAFGPAQVSAIGLAAPLHLRLDAGTVLNALSLEGTVSALGGSSLTGGVNLGAWSFGASGGKLHFSGSATSGFNGSLSLNVRDGGLNVSSLNLQGGGAALLQARGGIALGSIVTTRTFGLGLDVRASQCSSTSEACSAISAIAVDSIHTGAGGVRLLTTDNGDITVTGGISANGLEIQAGRTVFVPTGGFPINFAGYPTTNNVHIANATTSGPVLMRLNGHGTLTIDHLAASGSVDLRAGYSGTYYENTGSGYVARRTANAIAVHDSGTIGSGNYTVINQGSGDITGNVSGDVNITGNVNRIAGTISLSAVDGDITAAGALSTTNGSALFTAAQGSVSLQDVTARSGISASAGGDITFGKLGSSVGSVSLSSSGGAVRTRIDDTAADIDAAGSVTVAAAHSINGFIGDTQLANPLDIRAGAAISLSAGRDIGSAGRALRVDTPATVRVATTGGSFEVDAVDFTTGDARNVSGIELSASAAGVGAGNTANFRSAGVTVAASSDGTALTLADLAQAGGTLDLLRFTALGGGLRFGDVAFTGSSGIKQFGLKADGSIEQLSGSIRAGHTTIEAQGSVRVNDVTVATAPMNGLEIRASGDIQAGNLSANTLKLEGANLAIGSATTTGTLRGWSSPSQLSPRLGLTNGPEDLVLTASGSITSTGSISSATSARLTAGGSIEIAGGAGSVTGGTGITSSSIDTVSLQAGSTVRAATLAGARVELRATDAQVGQVIAPLAFTFNGGALSAGNVTAGTVQLTGGALSTGTVNATSSITIDAATSLATGSLSAAGDLSISTGGAYTATAAHSAARATISSGGDLTIGAGAALTAGEATLTTRAGSDGNIAAELRDTTRLTVNADRGFDVNVGNRELTHLTVNAQWDRATGAGSNGAEVTATSPLLASQSFAIGASAISAQSTSLLGSWNLSYNDSALAARSGGFELNLDPVQQGAFAFTMASDTDLTVNAGGLGLRLTPASFAFETGGSVTLAGVTTGGGALSATSRNGDVVVGTVNTNGLTPGKVTLIAQNGDIRAGGTGLNITTALLDAVGSLLPLGFGADVVLDAQRGSIGGGGAGTLQLAHAGRLTLRAQDTIDVNVGAGQLTSLDLEASVGGTGSVQVGLPGTNTLTLGRDTGANQLTLAGFANTTALTGNATRQTALALRATDGGVALTGNVSGLDNLTLQARAGDVTLAADSTARTVNVAGTLQLLASQDIRIASGAQAGASTTVNAREVQMNAGRDLRIEADAAAVSVASSAIVNQTLSAGRDFIVRGGSGTGASAQLSSASAATGNTYQTLRAGGQLLVAGGSGSNAHASVDTTGATVYEQRIESGGDTVVQGGTGAFSHARLQAATTFQQLAIGGSLAVRGGSGQDSHATWMLDANRSGSQSGSIGGDLIVQGGNASTGQGAGSYAKLIAGAQNIGAIGGAIRVAGGTGAGTMAELSSRTIQSLGVAYTGGGYGSGTDAILVQGGSGDGASAVLTAGGNQSLYAGRGSEPQETGNVEVLAGSGLNARAEITSGAAQTIGSNSTSCYYGCNLSTQDVRVQGGSATGATAAIRAATSQVVQAGGAISVIGGSVTGTAAEIVATGAGASQTIGSANTSQANATDLIEVRGGSGDGARIATGGVQTLSSGGNIVVAGGTGVNASALVESLNGSQVIGGNLLSGQDATDAILVQGGSAAGAFAAIRAGNEQTLLAGGSIAVQGGAAGAFAEVTTTGGTQRIGGAGVDGDTSYAWSHDATDSITVTGGAAGAHARIATTTGGQFLAAENLIALTGGTGAGSMAQVSAVGGQSVQSLGRITIQGGTDSGTGAGITGIVNDVNGAQTVTAAGNIEVTGGSGATDTGIVQQAAENLQTVRAGGNVLLVAPSVASGSLAIHSEGAQELQAGGALVLSNAAGREVRVHAAGGQQSVQAATLAIALGGTQANAFAGLSTAAGYDQRVHLLGDGTTRGSATVSVRNTSTGGNSLAGITSGGALDLQATDANYDAAGTVQVGHAEDQGRSEISAATELNLVAAALRIQGGATAAATAAVNAADAMSISTVYGATELVGGAAGSASIDPTLLNVVSTGSVLLQGGASASASSTITAGTFNLASTTGSLTLSSGGAAASISAGTFNYVGPQDVKLLGGTITVSNAGTITIDGVCVSCTTNLFGPFSISQYIPPPVPPAPPAPPAPPTSIPQLPQSPVPLKDYVGLVTGSNLSLIDLYGDTFQLVLLDDGTLAMHRNRRNQCL
ncbi:filamentous hemagglutinin N-terminal domain-containing protein [Ramlibacter sp. AN1015]|uniref:two-partner secretion domain-containing protein n=1 Tax=Ramlibacter sp. AN1015 TaxID=3133428 RepID=UPI0030C3A8D3